MWEEKPLSPNALLDEADHQAFLKREGAKMRTAEQPMRSNVLTHREMDHVLEAIGKFIADTLKPIQKRIAALEQQTRLKYVGPWKPARDYLPGEFVSYAGSIWHCKQHTGTRPNKCPEAWTLAVKSGRDAK
jgi:hypothetical protein